MAQPAAATTRPSRAGSVGAAKARTRSTSLGASARGAAAARYSSPTASSALNSKMFGGSGGTQKPAAAAASLPAAATAAHVTRSTLRSASSVSAAAGAEARSKSSTRSRSTAMFASSSGGLPRVKNARGAAADSEQQLDEAPFRTSTVFEGADGGRLSLSVCPGKKIPKGRNGRSYFRCLRRDLSSMREKAGVTRIICLLNPSELRTLGVQPIDYAHYAKQLGIDLVQFPMIEMSAPKDPASFDEEIIQPACRHIAETGSILVHCRGGVGRAGMSLTLPSPSLYFFFSAVAGLLACCVILRLGEVRSADEAIAVIRTRRDPRAVESQIQVNFVKKYSAYLDGVDSSLHLPSRLDLSCVRKGKVKEAQPGVNYTAARAAKAAAAAPNGPLKRKAAQCGSPPGSPASPADATGEERTPLARRAVSRCDEPGSPAEPKAQRDELRMHRVREEQAMRAVMERRREAAAVDEEEEEEGVEKDDGAADRAQKEAEAASAAAAVEAKARAEAWVKEEERALAEAKAKAEQRMKAQEAKARAYAQARAEAKAEREAKAAAAAAAAAEAEAEAAKKREAEEKEAAVAAAATAAAAAAAAQAAAAAAAAAQRAMSTSSEIYVQLDSDSESASPCRSSVQGGSPAPQRPLKLDKQAEDARHISLDSTSDDPSDSKSPSPIQIRLDSDSP